MFEVVIIYVFTQSILFKLWHIHAKSLQEKGFSILEILSYQRYVLIPSFILLIFSYKTEYLLFFLNDFKMILAFLFVVSVWMIHEYFNLRVQKSVNSLSFMNAFFAMLTLPIYVLVGTIFNGDIPNIQILFALIILGIAIFIKPEPHETNKKITFQDSMKFILSISLIGILVDALNNGAHRFVLLNLQAPLFGAALMMFLTTLIINIFFVFKKVPKIKQANNTKLIFYSLPLMWFIASIPESYSITAIPIFTIIALGSIAFFMDISSDIINNRIKMNIRTISFICLVLFGITISAFSL